jgi:hypothetical protein
VIPAIITNLIAGLLTLFVLSRIISDNLAFRIAQYLFVGVSMGYAFVVLYHQVLLPAIREMIVSAVSADWIRLVILVIPFLLSVLLLPRMVGNQTGSWLANFPLGLIFGVGVAVSLVGALAGTMLPQILATIAPAGRDPLQIAGAVLLALGVILVLSYFHFTAERDKGIGHLLILFAQAGRWFLMVAFGFFFAGALITYLTALNERFDGLIRPVLGG